MSESSRTDRYTDRVESVLAEYYDALEVGETPDLDALCGGDEKLLAAVTRLVRRESELEATLSATVEPQLPPVDGRQPASFGEFEVRELLGEGGAGLVYRAYDRSLEREVALKVLRPERRDERHRLRFRQEAAITAALEHPAIVPIYAVGEEQGLGYMAMKLLSGPALHQLPDRLSPIRTAELGARIADALHEAHRAGVVHRDVKPSNVILDGETPYILDFGLARASGNPTLTQEGAVPGTLAYMSPEQLRGRGDLGPSTDVYSLGATLYEAISGKPPFDTEPTRLMREICEADPAPLGLSGSDVDLDTIIRRAMEKDPRRRFADAAEMAAELRRFARGQSIQSRPPGFTSRTVRFVRRHRVTSLLSGLIVLTFVVSGSVHLAREARAREAVRMRCDAIDSALGRGEMVVAGRMLESLEREGRGEARVLELRSSVDARFALDDLLRAVLWRRDDLRDSERIAVVLGEVDRTGAARIRRPIPDLALGILEGLADEHDAARDRVEAVEAEFGRMRATVAIRAWLDGDDPAAALASGQFEPGIVEDAMDRVLAARVLWITDGPPEAQRKQVLAAVRADESDIHVRHALGFALHEAGNYLGALAAFDAVAARPSLHRNIARCSLANVEFSRGDLDAALARIDAIEPDGDDAVEYRCALIRLSVQYQRGDDSFGGALTEARDRWPNRAGLRRLHATRLEQDEEWTDAISLLAELVDSAARPSDRRRARMDWIRVRMKQLVQKPEAPASRKLQADARELESDAHAAADAEVEAFAIYVCGVLLGAGESLQILREAIRLDPRLYPARNALAHRLLLSRGGDVDEPDALQDALEQTRFVIDSEGFQAGGAHPSEVAMALRIHATVANSLQAWDDLLFSAQRLVDSGVTGAQQYVDVARRALGR